MNRILRHILEMKNITFWLTVWTYRNLEHNFKKIAFHVHVCGLKTTNDLHIDSSGSMKNVSPVWDVNIYSWLHVLNRYITRISFEKWFLKPDLLYFMSHSERISSVPETNPTPFSQQTPLFLAIKQITIRPFRSHIQFVGTLKCQWLSVLKELNSV